MVRRPAGEPDDFKRRPHLAVGICKPVAVKFKRPEQDIPPQGHAGAGGQHVGRAHAPEIGQKGQRLAVPHDDPLAVGHRQGKAGALQQLPEAAHIGKRRDTRGCTACNRLLGFHQHGAQFLQCVTARNRSHEQSVRHKCLADLHQEARQIVDVMEAEQRNDQVVPFGAKFRPFDIRVGETLDGCAGLEACERRCRRRPRRHEIEHPGKPSLDRGQAVAQIFQNTIEQEGFCTEAERTGEALLLKVLIKQAWHGCHRRSMPRAGNNGKRAPFFHAIETSMDPDASEAPRSAASRWRSLLARFGQRALDVVYPAHCPGCGAGTSEPGTLCGACWRQVPFIARPFCERLGVPFTVDIGGTLLSPQAIAEPPVFGRARAVALHEGHARDFVHRLKFSDRLDLAPPMGRMMAAAGREVLEGAEGLVPVPLHWTRLLWRRFNQAAHLAEAVSAATGIPVIDGALWRKKRTPQQIGLTRPQRIANLQGAFAVRDAMRPRVEGKALVLIDDVHTTGATLNATARVLLRAGAASVDVVTFTKVADPMKNPI